MVVLSGRGQITFSRCNMMRILSVVSIVFTLQAIFLITSICALDASANDVQRRFTSNCRIQQPIRGIDWSILNANHIEDYRQRIDISQSTFFVTGPS